MKYTFEKGEKSTVKVKMNLDAKEWDEAINSAYERVKGRYSLPGFRKGKVPRHLLEGAYGSGIFFEDALNFACNKYYFDILKKEPTIEAVEMPSIAVDKVDEKGIDISFEVPVKPEVDLGDYKSVKIKKIEYKTTDKDIEDELKHLQESRSRLVDVIDRAVEQGDTVTIDYSGAIDGVKFSGGTAEKQPLVIGSNTFIPGFEDQVVGMKIGEEEDIKVKFPDDYHAEDLKGKDAVFTVKLHEIKTKELPEINDEFIKDATGVESVEIYKKETKERLEKANADRAERETEDEIIKQITVGAKMEIPDALIERQIDEMLSEMEYRLSYQGLKFDDYLKYTGQKLEDIRNNYRSQATEIVKSQLVVDKLFTELNIKATDEEINVQIKELAEKQGKKEEEYKKSMGEKTLDYVKRKVEIQKLFDELKKLLKVDSKKVDNKKEKKEEKK